jgi:inhibitor of KinA
MEFAACSGTKQPLEYLMYMSKKSMNYPRYLDAGEAALVVEFGETADPAINAQVMLALDEAVATLALAGVRERVPTYRSLMIHYDPWPSRREELLVRHAIEIAVNASRQCDGRAALLCLRDRLIEGLTEVLERQ